MKISEMNTKQAATCLCKIAAPLGRIGQDKALNEYLKTMNAKKGQTMLELLSGALSALLPILLEQHYEDTVTVLSALTGKTDDEIEQQSILVTIREAQDVLDKDLIDFFTASADTAGER